ncbi:MAG: hypothetical protein AAFY08_15390 [Planctomycetota bacterium]
MLNRLKPDRWAFSLLELCVMVMVIGLLVALLLPSFHTRHGYPPHAMEKIRVRGIHQSLLMFAQSNEGWYPGLSAEGEPLQAGAVDGADESGAYPGVRYVILMDGNYFHGDFAISPLDSGKTAWTTTAVPVSTQHFSFSLLSLDRNWDGRIDRRELHSTERTTPDQSIGRVAEWRETLNAEAPVMSSRNTGDDGADRVSSIHGDRNSGDWRGHVAWNDNRVSFETSPTLSTRYAEGTGRAADQSTGDHLFVDESGDAADDAAMVYQDGRTLVGQR